MNLRGFIISFVPILFLFAPAFAQQPSIAAGPYIMRADGGATQLWLLTEHTKIVRLSVKGFPELAIEAKVFTEKAAYKSFQPAMFTFAGLPPGVHTIVVEMGSEKSRVTDTFNLDLRKPGADEEWSFLAGSCALREFGAKSFIRFGSPKIFRTMGDENADFMLWMGDNVYYLFGEWNTREGMVKKQIRMRLMPDLQYLMAHMPQFSIWDDHDFGPNNSNCDFECKDIAMEVNDLFWGRQRNNEGRTTNGEGGNDEGRTTNGEGGSEILRGNFGSYRWGNAEFFLLDNRYYRGIEGAEGAHMLGPEQMAWLKNGLKASVADFKFIVSGSQVINELNYDGESWAHFPLERDDFFNFLREEKIAGLLFLTGDRHFSEFQKRERAGTYPLYDFTCSPLTSFINPAANKDPEASNPEREAGSLIQTHNFALITLKGRGVDAATCTLTVKDNDGKVLWVKTIEAKELR